MESAQKNRKIAMIVALVFTFVLISGGLIGLIVSAATPVEARVAAEGEAPECAFEDVVGKTEEEAKAMLAKKAAGRPVRAYKSGSPVTMDYSADRINLELDEQGKVIKASCG